MMLSRVLPGVAWGPSPSRASISSGSPWASSRSPWFSRSVSRSWTSRSNSLTSSRPTSLMRLGSFSSMNWIRAFDQDGALGGLLAEQVDGLRQDRQARLIASAGFRSSSSRRGRSRRTGRPAAARGSGAPEPGGRGRDRQRAAVGSPRRVEGDLDSSPEPLRAARPAARRARRAGPCRAGRRSRGPPCDRPGWPGSPEARAARRAPAPGSSCRCPGPPGRPRAA